MNNGKTGQPVAFVHHSTLPDVDQDDDSLLVERAKQDSQAFGVLYERHVGRIYTYIYYRTGNQQDAEDLTARTFHKALDHIKRYNNRGAPFSAWLYRIAHNLVIDYYRRRGRTTQVSLDDMSILQSKSESTENAAERSLAADHLRMAINQLTEEQAQVITLRFLESMSITEVADNMGKTEGAIKALQYRAVSSLRRIMEVQL